MASRNEAIVRRGNTGDRLLVQHESLSPHSVEITQGASGGLGVRVKVYRDDPRAAAREAVALFVEVKATLHAALAASGPRPVK